VRILIALIIGIAIGAIGLWVYSTREGRDTLAKTGQQIETATKSARDAIQEKVSTMNLRPQDIKDELARSGQVVRRSVEKTGKTLADATADARITAAIKTKLVADRELSALSVSVSTTGGVVTLSGQVPNMEQIGRAMVLAMDVEGVREVVSTLQVKAPAK